MHIFTHQSIKKLYQIFIWNSFYHFSDTLINILLSYKKLSVVISYFCYNFLIKFIILLFYINLYYSYIYTLSLYNYLPYRTKTLVSIKNYFLSKIYLSQLCERDNHTEEPMLVQSRPSRRRIFVHANIDKENPTRFTRSRFPTVRRGDTKAITVVSRGSTPTEI